MILTYDSYSTEFIVIADYEQLFDELFDGTIDIIPSVWYPDGHSTYLEESGRNVNQDYVITGVTSEEGVFFWMASAGAYNAGIRSIDDLADPAKTNGFDMRVYQSSPADTGLALKTMDIVDDVNAARIAVDQNAPLFYYNSTWNDVVEDELYAFLDANLNNDTSKFLVAWFTPWWGYEQYISNGPYHQLNNGNIGGSIFGRTNRGSTVTTPNFLGSGVIDETTWNALSTIFVSNAAISAMDTNWHNYPDKTLQQVFQEMVEDIEYSIWYYNYANISQPFASSYSCDNDL
jgi:hypothetical protein